jgi:hypothetical protein
MRSLLTGLALLLSFGFLLAQKTVLQSAIPEKIDIGELSNIFHPVHFAHGLHARMTAMGDGCATCHHHAEEEIYEPCSVCHLAEDPSASLAMPTLNGAYHRNCLNCHQNWMDEDVCHTCHLKKRFTFNARKTLDETDVLAYTHNEITIPEIVHFIQSGSDVKPVLFHHREHTELYRFDCATCHRETDCAKCHQYVPHEKKITVLDNHHQPCSACHEVDQADGCTNCHTSKPADGFRHESTGFSLKSFHFTLSCEACHVGHDPIEALDPNCTTCHKNFEVGLFDHTVTGLQLSEDHVEIDCYECHTDEKYDRSPTCVECHDEDLTFPTQLPGKSLHHE